jgi:thioredoxin 1
MKKISFAVLCLLFAVMIYAGSRPKQVETSTAINAPAPVTIGAQTAIKVVKKYKVTFVELGSVKCVPCKMMVPIMKEIEEKYGAEVQVIFHDVWTEEGRPYAEKLGIRGIPTQVFLDENGKEFYRHMGYYPMEQIIPILKKQGVKVE